MEPTQKEAGPKIEDGVAGRLITLIAMVLVEEVPHILVAETPTVPVTEVLVTEMVFDVELPVQPEGKDQLYTAILESNETLYVLVVPAHMLDGPIIVAGAEGNV